MRKRIKIYMILSALALTLIFASAILLYDHMIQAVKKEAYETVETNTQAIVNSINERLNAIEQLGYSLTNNAVLTRFLTQNYYSDVQIILEMKNIIIPFIALVDTTSRAFIDNFKFITSSSRVVYNTHIYPKEAYDQTGWFPMAEEHMNWHTPYWITQERSDPENFYLGNLYDDTCSLYMQIWHSGEIKTFVELNVRYDSLFADIPGLGEDESLLITDRGKDVVYQRGNAPTDLLDLDGTQYYTTTVDIDRLDFTLTTITPFDSASKSIERFRSIFIAIFAGVLAIFFLIVYMMSRIRRLADQNYLAEIQHTKSVIDSLQKQINPHFIYNTIETFKMMAEVRGHEDLSDALTSFGGLIRYTMSHGSASGTLGDELNNLQDYICIQKLLKNKQLTLHHDITGSVLKLPVPVLVLQPIAENAILYGYDGKTMLHITVRCRQENNRATITVSNSGRPIEPAKLAELERKLRNTEYETELNEQGRTNGIALINIHCRIRLKYGPPYGLSIENTENGVAVKIHLPAGASFLPTERKG